MGERLFAQKRIYIGLATAVGAAASIVTILAYFQPSKPSIHLETRGDRSPAISAGGSVSNR
jgi:hypothetical protein